MPKRKTLARSDGLPSIAAGLSVYHDYDSLQRCIPSLLSKVDLIIAVYGKYQGFGGYQYNSDPTSDDIHKYLESLPRTVIVDLDPASQVSKRSKYLEVAGQYKIDILLVIDADEWIEERKEYGGWNDFRKRAAEILQDADSDGFDFIHNLYGIWERYGEPDQLQHNPRCILRPSECEYFNRHNWVRNKQRGYRLWMEPPFSKGIILRGNNELRTPERERLMDQYEAFQAVCDERYT